MLPRIHELSFSGMNQMTDISIQHLKGTSSGAFCAVVSFSPGFGERGGAVSTWAAAAQPEAHWTEQSLCYEWV